MLNSNQNFQMNDSFHVSFTHVLGEPQEEDSEEDENFEHYLTLQSNHCKGCQQNGCKDYMEPRA